MDGLDGLNDAKCTKILPATSAAPKYKFVMPTEFVMKHMSHLIEKQLQLVDDSDRSFTVTLIQRRNKDKYEYMLSGWRKYGDVNQIREGDTVLFEMLNPGVLKVTVVAHGAAVPRAPKGAPKRKRVGAESDEEDDYEDRGPLGPPQQLYGGPPPLGLLGGEGSLHTMSQRAASPSGGMPPRVGGPSDSLRSGGPPGGPPAGGQTVSPFEMAGRAGLPGFGPLDPPPAGPSAAANLVSQPSPLLPMLNLPQRQQTTPADQLAAALTAVQQLELPPSELLALMHGTTTAASLSDLAPLPSTDLLALMQQQMGITPPAAGGGTGPAGPPSAFDRGGPPGGVGPALEPGSGGGLGGMQPTVAELAAVVNQLEKQARGEGSQQQPDNAPAWEVLLQENVQLREDLQQWKAKVASLQGVVANVGRAIHMKTDPGLVAMTGVFNAMNQIEAPDFLPDLPPRARTGVQEVLAELRQQLNAVLQMVWEVRQLSDQLGRELQASEEMGKPPSLSNGL